MEAAASIIGLLAVGAKIYTVLEQFLSSCVDAPQIAITTRDEVRDFRYAIERLRPYIQRSIPITPLGAASTDVNQLSLTLASCIVTFSQLEKTLDRLLSRNKMDTIGRVRWTMAGGNISQLVTRLQQHKSTLMLLLTIWMSESAAEAEQKSDQLNDALDKISALMQQFVNTVPASAAVTHGKPPIGPKIGALSIRSQDATMDSDSSSIRTVASDWRSISQSVFQSALFTSKPYKGIARTDTSGMSLTSSQYRGTRWSIFSGGSNTSVLSLPYTTTFQLSGTTLVDTPDVSTIPIPISMDTLHNPWWYPTTGVSTPPSTEGPILSPMYKPPSPRTREGPNLSLLYAVAVGDTATALRELAQGADVNSKGPHPKDSSAQLTALDIAIMMKNKTVVEALLYRGVDLRIAEGFNPLLLAAELSTGEIVQLLISGAAGIREIGDILNTALHTGVKNGNEEAVTVLLDRGVGIECRLLDGYTPLQEAVLAGQLAVAKALLDRGADMRSEAPNGWALLHLAAYSGHDGVAKLLLDRGAQIEGKSSGSYTPLQQAVQAGHLEVAKVLLDRGADMRREAPNGCTLLYLAAHNGHSGLVELLLDRGAEIDSKSPTGDTPLHGAVKAGRLDVAKVLLDRGADMRSEVANGWTLLHLAAHSGHRDVAGLLLDRGAGIDSESPTGYTPLHRAVKAGHLDVAKVLLDRGAHIESKDNNGWTPLHLAAQDGHGDVAEFLLDRGANTESSSFDRSTPVHMASWGGHTGLVEILLDSGAEINKIPDRYPPLHRAVEAGHQATVELLLRRGAECQRRSHNGSTALHVAARMGHVAIIQALLDRGALVESKDYYGETPLAIAKQRGDTGAASLLKRYSTT